MRSKQRPQARRSKQPKAETKFRSENILPDPQGAGKLGTRERLLQVASDIRRDLSLTFTEAASNRGVDGRSRHKYLKKLFYRDATGRIRATKSDNYRETLVIPNTHPGQVTETHTKNSEERSVVGRWIAAINAAAGGDFSKIQAFPKGQSVGGVRLATSPYEVQRILEAMATSGERFDGPYRGKVVRA
jgi:hypothetical protein